MKRTFNVQVLHVNIKRSKIPEYPTYLRLLARAQMDLNLQTSLINGVDIYFICDTFKLPYDDNHYVLFRAMASAPKINILKYEDDDKHIIDPILLDVDDSQETGMYMVNGIQ